MRTFVVTSAIIKNKGKYLIAKRSNTKEFAPGVWEFISGFIEEKTPAEDTVLRELQEELNIPGKITKSFDAITTTSSEDKWIVIPYHVEVNTRYIKPKENEHSEIRWVTKEELINYTELLGIDSLLEKKLFSFSDLSPFPFLTIVIISQISHKFYKGWRLKHFTGKPTFKSL